MPMKTLKKYRVCVKRNHALHVAADSPDQVAKACFPNHEVSFWRSGPGWYQFKVSPSIPFGWPHDVKAHQDQDYGDVLDIEDSGHVWIVEGDQHDPDKE
jgi:hypothetical protein